MTPRSRFAVVAVLALAACASDNASPSSSSSSSPLPSRTNASITLAGDSDIVNAFEQPVVRCQFPDVGGRPLANASLLPLAPRPAEAPALAKCPSGASFGIL